MRATFNYTISQSQYSQNTAIINIVNVHEQTQMKRFKLLLNHEDVYI